MIIKSFWWWRNPESNWGHKDFQSSALPTELFRPDIVSQKLTPPKCFDLGLSDRNEK